MRIDRLKLWLTAAAVGGLLPVSAVLAADLPVKALAPLAYYDWSGAYVGVHAGLGGGMKDWTDSTFDYAARGFLAGGQIGINKQIASFVFGLELDGSWANIGGSQNILFGGPLLGGLETTTANSRIDGLVTFAGRAGLAADRWFVFAKGGLAGAWEWHSFKDAVTIFAPPSQFSASATAASSAGL
jgi:outer membrane immunogenic protein